MRLFSCIPVLLFACMVSSESLQAVVPTGFQAGASPYTPQQLHELLVGQQREAVLLFFGRIPDHTQGVDWVYNQMLIYVAESDRYYTTAIVCFSHGDHLVWQVVCYP